MGGETARASGDEPREGVNRSGSGEKPAVDEVLRQFSAVAPVLVGRRGRLAQVGAGEYSGEVNLVGGGLEWSAHGGVAELCSGCVVAGEVPGMTGVREWRSKFAGT
jgi:hypothetical protein